ncbi:MAG: MFS transporter, partial [Halobacteriales archaeon]|nr:MFS transporter [Halobacteriales archaeon]
LGATGVATAFVSGFEELLVLRFLQGMAFAGTGPLTIIVIGDLYTDARGSSAQGLRSSVNGVANSIAPAVAGLLAGITWRYPFLLFGLAFPAVGLLLLYLPETHAAAEESSTAGFSQELYEYWRAFKAEAGNIDFAVMATGGFILFTAKAVIKTFVPLFAVAVLGVSVFRAGLLLTLYGVIRVISSPFAGSAVALLGRKRTLVFGMGAIVVGIGLLAISPDLYTVGLFVVIYTLGEAFFDPVLNDTIAQYASTSQRGGLLSGLNALKNLAAAVAPAVFGLVIALVGFRNMFVIAAIVPVLYVALVVSVLSLE